MYGFRTFLLGMYGFVRQTIIIKDYPYPTFFCESCLLILPGTSYESYEKLNNFGLYRMNLKESLS